MAEPTRDDAWELFCEWTESDSLRKHALGVEAAMRAYARKYGEVDELSGFIAACALVRPTGIEGMKPKSVRKKLKQPSFAAKVDRDQIQRAIEELGVDETEHIQLVIDALAERADELGLAPRPQSPA